MLKPKPPKKTNPRRKPALDDEEDDDAAKEETFPHGIEPVKAETLEIVRDLIELTGPAKGTAKSN